MSRRWNWDFEDEQAARRKPLRLPLPDLKGPVKLSGAGRVQIRRRRLGAGIGLIVLIAVLVAALSGSAHRGPGSAGRNAQAAGGRPAGAPKPTETESDRRAAVASVLGYTPFLRAGGSRGRDVALTFDDGPGPYTPEVLAVLERFHVQATFFVIGKMLRYFGAAAAREVQDGDAIGDHTETHPMLAQLSAHEQREQLFEQIARVELLGGSRPDLFRPPYGSFNATTMRQLRALHLLMVLWSVDTGDYLQPGVPAIVERALAGARPGAIILMHDAGGTRTQTIAALPAIIRGIRAKGLHLVTVPQLALDDPPPAGQVLPPNLSGD